MGKEESGLEEGWRCGGNREGVVWVWISCWIRCIAFLNPEAGFGKRKLGLRLRFWVSCLSVNAVDGP